MKIDTTCLTPTALYVRVSKDEQHPENQVLELKQYVQNHPALVLYGLYEDHISGMKDTRPELDRLMNDARKRQFKHVVIWKVDRLGRSTSHFFNIIDEWNKLGITYSITTLGLDTSTPTGKFVVGLLAQVAELERQFIVERVHLGLDKIQYNIKTKGFHVTDQGKVIKKLGRPKGSKDKKVRKKSGYYQRWSKSGK